MSGKAGSVEMKSDNGTWKLLAVIWYGLLVVVLLLSYKFGHLRLSLLTVGLLAVYGALLFSSKSLAGKAHRYNKVHPWVFLLIGISIGYTGDRWWFSEPHFNSVAAEQDPFQLPLEIEGIHLQMTPDQVLETLDSEPAKQRHYFGDVSLLRPETAFRVARALYTLRSTETYLSMPRAEEIMETLQSRPEGSLLDPSHLAQSLTLKLLAQARKGRKLGAILVAEPLSRESVQPVLRSLASEQLELENLLLVTTSSESAYKAILIERLRPGSHWRVEARNLDILFSESGPVPKIVMIGGDSISIGGRAWSQTGSSMSSLHTPGRPLQEEFVNLLREPSITTYRKEWGDAELRACGDFKRIERIEIWRVEDLD